MKPKSYTRIFQLFHVYPYGKSLVLHFDDPKVMQAYVDQARAEHPEHYTEFYVSLLPQSVHYDVHLIEAIFDISQRSVNLFNVHDARIFLTNSHASEGRLRLNAASLNNENVIKYWREVDFIDLASLYARAYFIPLKFPNVLFYMFFGSNLNDSFQVTKDICSNLGSLQARIAHCAETGSFDSLRNVHNLDLASTDVHTYAWNMYTPLHRFYSNSSNEATVNTLQRMRIDAQLFAQMTGNNTLIEYTSFENMNGISGNYFNWVEQNWPGSLPALESVEPGPEQASGEAPVDTNSPTAIPIVFTTA
jgi:hypothetical protein